MSSRKNRGKAGRSDLAKRSGARSPRKPAGSSGASTLEERNLAAFARDFPAIAAAHEAWRRGPRPHLTAAPSGEADLRDPATGRLLFGGRAREDAAARADLFARRTGDFVFRPDMTEQPGNVIGPLHFAFRNTIVRRAAAVLRAPGPAGEGTESLPCVIIIGAGLGHIVRELYSRLTPLYLWIIEPDPHLFHLSLQVTDWSRILDLLREQGLHIRFSIGDCRSTITDDLNMFFNLHPAAFAAQGFLMGYSSTGVAEVTGILAETFHSVDLKVGFLDDLLFSFAHGCRNLAAGIPVLTRGSLPPETVSRPLLLVGNGPSLDRDLDYIRAHRDRFLIMACGTAFSALCHSGIRADFYAGLERGINDSAVLRQIREHREYFQTTLCLGTEIPHPGVFSQFSRKMVILKENEITAHWLRETGLLPKDGDFVQISNTNPLVVNFGLAAALTLGFRTVLLLGVDNGSADSNGLSHSRHSMYFDAQGAAVDQQDEKRMNDMPFTCPGNFRQEVRTTTLYMSCVRSLERCIAARKDQGIRVFNCSDGARIRNARPLRLEDFPLPDTPADGEAAVQAVLQLGRPLGITAGDIQRHFAEAPFEDLIREIREMLLAPAPDRLSFLKRQDRFLEELERTKRKDWHKFFLSGSLIYLLLPVNTMIYSLPLQADPLTRAAPLLQIIARFLDRALPVLRRAPEYVAGEHQRILIETGGVDPDADQDPGAIADANADPVPQAPGSGEAGAGGCADACDPGTLAGEKAADAAPEA